MLTVKKFNWGDLAVLDESDEAGTEIDKAF